MRSLTGGSADTVGARSLAWADLKRSVDDPGVFVGAGSTRRLSDDELNGVVGGHAYSVFRVVEAGGVAAAAAREALLAYDGDTQIRPASQTAATPNKFLPRARTRGVAHTRGLAFGLRCLLLVLSVSRWAACAERHFEGVPDACGYTTSDCVYNCTSGAACSDPTVCCTYYPSAQLTDMDEMLQLIDLRIDCGHENWVYPHTLNWCSGPWVEEVAWHGSLTSLCTDDWLVTDPCTGGIVVAPPGKTAASYYFPAMYYAWSGVTCVEDEDSGSWEVDILSLVDHNMTCAINATSLDRLDKLEELSLNGNQLYGPLPHWVGKLRTLTKIYLHENALTGALPEGWQHARNLQKISLHTSTCCACARALARQGGACTRALSHGEDGARPRARAARRDPRNAGARRCGREAARALASEAARRAKARVLMWICREVLIARRAPCCAAASRVCARPVDQLTGPVPEAWFPMKNGSACDHHGGLNLQLSNLELHANALSGALPAGLRCPSLSELDLRRNAFSGALPEFEQLSTTTKIDLSENGFAGGLPAAIGTAGFSPSSGVHYLNEVGTLPPFAVWNERRRDGAFRDEASCEVASSGSRVVRSGVAFPSRQTCNHQPHHRRARVAARSLRPSSTTASSTSRTTG